MNPVPGVGHEQEPRTPLPGDALSSHSHESAGGKYRLGVVIGRFYPPHRGHKLLIDTALSQCEHAVVFVCARPTDKIPGPLRGRWLQEIHPNAEVMVIDDVEVEGDSRIWAENTLRWLGAAPEAVFSSEDYGKWYATLMGAIHVMVDKQRHRVPISGTIVRSDPYSAFDYLEPVVRAWFVKRVCVLEAEPIGTASLAQRLAQRLNTLWVPDFGREYALDKTARKEKVWTSEDFVQIAREQTRREDEAARQANRVLFCDGNAFAIALWHRRYMSERHPEVEAIARQSRCDLYLIAGEDHPYAHDSLGEAEHIREEMQRWIESALARQNARWELLQGSAEEHLAQAVSLTQNLFEGSKWVPGLERAS